MDTGQNAIIPAADELLSLRQVAERLGVGYDRLYGYAGKKGFTEAIGTVKTEGRKGLFYPPLAVARLSYLLKAQDEGKVTPGTAVAYLSDAELIQPFSQNANLPVSQNAIIDVDEINGGILANSHQTPVALLSRLVELAERQSNAPPDDELLTMAQARERYGVPVAILRGLRVTVGKRRYVRRNDVLRFIQEL